MKLGPALAAVLLAAGPAAAGVHYSGEPLRELPARWRGFLPDHRLLRTVGAQLPGDLAVPPLRDAYADARLTLESSARTRPLTADEAADLGALLIRLGHPADAVGVLRPAARANPNHFRLAANLGTAWQLAGDLTQAGLALDEAVRLAPQALKPAEVLHRKLVRLRAAAGKGGGLDDLFGIPFTGPDGKPSPEKIDPAQATRLPADALALVQRMAVWLPADGRLLWQLGELANANGDVRTAAFILDGCVTEFGLDSTDLRQRRQAYRAAADAADAAGDHRAVGGPFKSTRALVRAVDPAKLPPIRPAGVTPLPWAVVTETELGAAGKPRFLQYLSDLDGKRVSVTGFVTPIGGGTGGKAGGDLTGFLFTENPVGCWFCDTPGPTRTLVVELTPGATTDPTRQVVKLTGTLILNRADPEQYPVRLTGAAVSAAD